MKKVIVISLVALALACTASRNPKEQKMEVLAQEGNCTLYKIKDKDRTVYWSVCQGHTATSVAVTIP